MIRFDLSIRLEYTVVSPTDFVFTIQPTNTTHQRVTWEQLAVEPDIPVEEHIKAVNALGGLKVLGTPKADNMYHAGWAWAGSRASSIWRARTAAGRLAWRPT